MQLLHIVDYLLKSGGNGKTAPVGNLSEKHIKVGYSVLHAVFKIAVAHGQLIEIAQHGKVYAVCVIHTLASAYFYRERGKYRFPRAIALLYILSPNIARNLYIMLKNYR